MARSPSAAGGCGCALALGLITCFTACGGSASTSPPPPAPVSVAIHPSGGSIILGAPNGTVQFSANVTNDSSNLGVTWAVDGVASGNQTVGTISAAGLYTAPGTTGSHIVQATSVRDASKSSSGTVGISDLAGVTTYHNDLARDGVNSQEYALKPASVSVSTFGKRFSCAVDGAIYTQPLWVAGLSINGGMHNVVFVATQHNSLYAFDADSSPCLQLWHADLIDSAHGAAPAETSVCWYDVGSGFGDIQPEIGVTGTPVIDLATNTLYVLSKSETGGCTTGSGASFVQRLHAIDITSGIEQLNSPVAINASIAGTGDGSSGGMLSFNPQSQGQRPGLALLTNVSVGGAAYKMVVIAWASHEDAYPYHGWLIGYNAGNVQQQLEVFNSTPNGGLGGIWMGGEAPAVDANNNLFIATGNGTFDADVAGKDYGNSVLEIASSGALSTLDFFTPNNQGTLNQYDSDLGSGGVVLLPDQTTGPPHLLIQGGKQGLIYLLDRDNLGGYSLGGDHVVQEFQADNGSWTTPVFWQNTMYIAGSGDHGSCDALKAYGFTAGTGFNTTPSSMSTHCFGFPGATASLSSAGQTNGIVWATDVGCYGTAASSCGGPAVLYAFDASSLSSQLWSSTQTTRDQAGNAVKFSVPTVANGKVYVGTRTELDVYGFLP